LWRLQPQPLFFFALMPDIALEPQRTQSTQRNPWYFRSLKVKLREWIWKALNSRLSWTL